MADHEHGSMDIKEHEKVFNGFMSFVTKSVLWIIAILLFMAVFAR